MQLSTGTRALVWMLAWFGAHQLSRSVAAGASSAPLSASSPHSASDESGKLAWFDHFMFDTLPRLLTMPPSDYRAAEPQLVELAMANSPDDLAQASFGDQCGLIQVAGFKCEQHQHGLIRLVNPLAEPGRLRPTPVLLVGGPALSSAAYLIASTSQHVPEVWPAQPGAPQPGQASWNRSLAFALANHGYHVWLAELAADDSTELEPMLRLVLDATHSSQVSVVSYSFAAANTLGFLAANPGWAARVSALVTLGPVLAADDIGRMLKQLNHHTCPLLTKAEDKQALSNSLLTKPARDLALLLTHSKFVRYSLLKPLLAIILGPSSKYRTLLDMNVIAYLLRHLAPFTSKVLCMQKDRLQVAPNDLLNMTLKSWLLVTGSTDALSTSKAAQSLVTALGPHRVTRLEVADFNHLDLIAGVDNDQLINRPIMAYLDAQTSKTQSFKQPGSGRLPVKTSGSLGGAYSSGARMLDIAKVIAMPNNIKQAMGPLTNVKQMLPVQVPVPEVQDVSTFVPQTLKLIKPGPPDVQQVFHSVQNNIQEIITSLSSLFDPSRFVKS